MSKRKYELLHVFIHTLLANIRSWSVVLNLQSVWLNHWGRDHNGMSYLKKLQSNFKQMKNKQTMFFFLQVVKILEKHEPGRSSTSALSFLSGHVSSCSSSSGGYRLGPIPADEASAVQNYVEHMLFLLMEEEAGQGKRTMKKACFVFLMPLCCIVFCVMCVMQWCKEEQWVPFWSLWFWRVWWRGFSCGA